MPLQPDQAPFLALQKGNEALASSGERGMQLFETARKLASKRGESDASAELHRRSNFLINHLESLKNEPRNRYEAAYKFIMSNPQTQVLFNQTE